MNIVLLVASLFDNSLSLCLRGGIGRHATFRMLSFVGEGSNPSEGTNFNNLKIVFLLILLYNILIER